jgi:hypothetical protein
VATDPNAAVADTHVDGDPFAEDPGVDNDEHSELPDPPPCQHRPFNRQGMGGNQNHHNQHYVRNDDPFAKVKFYIPPFNGSYDAEAYLDWEMTVEQKFGSHLVPEQHRVRQRRRAIMPTILRRMHGLCSSTASSPAISVWQRVACRIPSDR